VVILATEATEATAHSTMVPPLILVVAVAVLSPTTTVLPVVVVELLPTETRITREEQEVTGLGITLAAEAGRQEPLVPVTTEALKLLDLQRHCMVELAEQEQR
jgi:hypothetical protein